MSSRILSPNDARRELARRLAAGAAQAELEAYVAALPLAGEDRDGLLLWVLAECSEPRTRRRRIAVPESPGAGLGIRLGG